ncbi:MAG: HGGxSTG domain-containing protein [Paracoccus sp. (in: a-proteobacteria)]|nr:HGGxSTG domain-containing protein [Paracoccus sp. (in: a-proteobacteria)]
MDAAPACRRRRVRCGAKTRKGTACRNKPEPGKRRCKFHGGMSTGARTPEGIERIREAQRRRWAKVRDQSVSATAPHKHHDPAVTPDLQGGSDAST